MPSQYSGQLTALLAALPGQVSIASVSNATPVTVTTATPHGAETGDTVMIAEYPVTYFNKPWRIIKLSNTTLQLVGSTSQGAHGAAGLLRSMAFLSTIPVVSSGDPKKPDSVAIGLEGLADRSALLLYLLQNLVVHAGGIHEFEPGSGIQLDSGSAIFAIDNAAIEGVLALAVGALLKIRASAQIQFLDSSVLQMQANSLLQIMTNATETVAGLLSILSGGKAEVQNGGLLDIKGDGDVTPGSDGDVILRSGAMLEAKAGSVIQLDPGSTLLANGPTSGASTINMTCKGTAITYDNCDINFLASTQIVGTQTDASTTNKSGPIVHSGANGYVGGRDKLVTANASGTERMDPWSAEIVELGVTLTGNVTWIWSDPPNGERVTVTINATGSKLNGFTVTAKNAAGVAHQILTGSDDVWADQRWNSAIGNWQGVRFGTN